MPRTSDLSRRHGRGRRLGIRHGFEFEAWPPDPELQSACALDMKSQMLSPDQCTSIIGKILLH